MALIVQLAIGVGFVVLAVNGFPLVGGGGSGDTAASPRATGPFAPVPAATANRFDTQRALALIRRQVAVGQRPAVRQQRAQPLGAHYDTEFHPPGFVGANDSAAGTAAVIEIARDLRAEPRPPNAREVRFVLFDGEEDPPGTTDFYTDALRGSKAYVNAHRGQIRQMVLLDYIANRGLRLPREGSSSEPLWSQMRAAAASVGVGAVFPATAQTTILDDHTPFLRAGIPAIDLIDFSYRYADTVRDTVDKLSERSLDAVGESTVALMRELRAS